jgi:uncharacterized membrane protein YccF (DUF307 family)
MAMRDWDTWESVRMDLIMWLLALLVGWWLGWAHAHSTVAKECRRLGGFYVNGSTFKCIEVAPSKSPAQSSADE